MADDKQTQRLSRIEKPVLMSDAEKIAGFAIGKRPEYAAAANISGVRTKALTFSRRRDSLTIFASDNRYGPGGRAGAWTGDDKRVVAACRRVLRAAKIPSKEIAGIEVLSEQGTVAEVVSENEFRVEEPQLLRKVGRAERAVQGLPVWSSHLQVGLTAKGEIGELELHWPRLTAEVLDEAEVLRKVAGSGFQPPDVKGGTPESIEAGIVHSPAIGFFMDIIPVIRVIYSGDERGGKKPTLYVDRHSELVTLPRQVKVVKPDAVGRPEAR